MAKIPFNVKFRPQIESGEYMIEDYDGLETLYWPEMDGWEEIPEKK